MFQRTPTVTLAALEMALWQRRDLEGLVHHSAAASNLSIRYTERLAEAGVELSVGSRGDACDCESVSCRRAA